MSNVEFSIEQLLPGISFQDFISQNTTTFSEEQYVPLCQVSSKSNWKC